MKKLYIVLSICVLLAVAAGAAFAQGDTLTVIMAADSKSLDPHAAPDLASTGVMNQMMESLITIRDGEIVPLLAEKYEKLDDLNYKFYLRKGVKFHNGEELKASDVKFTFTRAVNTGKVIDYVVRNIDIDKIQILDDYTIIVPSKTPDSSFLACLSHYCAGVILSEKAVKDAGDNVGTQPVGTGPYQFVSWQKGNRIVLKGFDGYWGDKAKTPNLIFRTITEGTSRCIELETGGADVALNILPIDVDKVSNNAKLSLLRVPSRSVMYLGMNVSNEPLSDIRVRKAINLAVDNRPIVKIAFRNVGQPPRGPVPPTIKYYDTSLPEILPDVEKAKALLAEAGYKDGMKLELWCRDDKTYTDTATIIQSQLKKVGIDISIQVMEWGAFLEKLKQREQQLYLQAWNSVIADPDYSLFGVFHSSQKLTGLNRGVYGNPEVDKLLEEGKRVNDGPEREAIYHKLQHMILDDAAWGYLHVNDLLIGMQKNVKGFIFEPSGNHQYYQTYFE
ncbi:MAG: ABC transporter substrate-binding protein [Synergistaceae bacterium]|jgi:peptide/nickel transport system substrate-binding protein|nr:ABC transporter substrate-binding protein [Synergistaceae bacterium]